jgi:hypothetical protein
MPERKDREREREREREEREKKKEEWAGSSVSKSYKTLKKKPN